jgi:7,8-dihydropterin-6-yl-methyl-4-(beta-D-ribofuranosyl)aminobenzene 5'-phosphate synthase
MPPISAKRHIETTGIRVTTLCENTAGQERILAEHGLSMLLEVDGQAFLLDTGQTYTVLHNAQTLDVDLRHISAVVLSHGHYDHTGGLRHLSRWVKQMRVLAHPDVLRPRYVIQDEQPPRHVGLPFTFDELEGNGVRFEFSTSPTELSSRVILTGQIPRTTAYEEMDKHLCVNVDGVWEQDHVWDDQAIIIKTHLGLVVALGCAHAGIINTLTYAQQITGEERIYAVLGGTHLGPASSEQLLGTVEALEALRVQKLGVCHCTGSRAGALLAEVFGDRFFYNTAGTVVEL